MVPVPSTPRFLEPTRCFCGAVARYCNDANIERGGTVSDDDGKAVPIQPIAAKTITKTDPGDNVVLRQPVIADGAAIWSLIRDTGVLDVNSAYSYLMLSKFFTQTCVVAEDQ